MSQHSTGLSREERKASIAGAGKGARGPPDQPVEALTVTVKQTKQISNLSLSTIWKLVAEGRLEVVRVYNRTLITTASLRKLLSPPE